MVVGQREKNEGDSFDKNRGGIICSLSKSQQKQKLRRWLECTDRRNYSRDRRRLIISP